MSEDDVHLAHHLLQQIPSCPSDPNKAERILGYASSRLAREKALQLLGTSEEEVAIENAKNLGSLGVAGRRRSFVVQQSEVLTFARAIPKIRRHSLAGVSIRRRRSFKRRRSSSASELRRLRNLAKSSEQEIASLKERIYQVEKMLTGPNEGSNTASHRD